MAFQTLSWSTHRMVSHFVRSQPQTADDIATAPTALSNGPTIIEAQADFVTAAISKLEESNASYMEPQADAEKQWCAYVDAIARKTLFPETNSWWTGGNVPGKKVQMLTYILGLDQYEKECRDRLDRWEGFDVKYNSQTNGTKFDEGKAVNGAKI